LEIKDIRAEDELSRAIQQGTTLIFFRAPWFALCHLQEPILSRVASQFKGKASIGAVNVDQIPEIAWKLRIRSVPTLILFKNSKEIQRFVGLQPEETLADALRTFLK